MRQQEKMCSHCHENPIYVFLFWELRGLNPNFYIHVSVSDLFSILSGSVHIFSCSRIGRSIVGIYKSLTDTWIWKLGLWPRNCFSGNMCFEFSVSGLCSARTVMVFMYLYLSSHASTLKLVPRTRSLATHSLDWIFAGLHAGLDAREAKFLITWADVDLFPPASKLGKVFGQSELSSLLS